MPDRFQTRRFTPTLQKALELKAQKEYEKNIPTQSQPQTVQPESKASTGERVLATVGDFFGNIITGAAKGIEGIIDLGASVVGGIGGLFDQDFQNDVQDWVSNDWVGENIGNPIQEGTKASYLNDSKAGEIIEGIASGVGQMLPSIALTVATGGAAAPGMAVMAASAAGNATEEAYNQGAGYGQGLAYGALSGIVEAATEKIGGVVLGGGTSLVGKKLAGTALGKATSKGIGKVAETFVSEGAEEVLSDLANPALKYVTGVDKNIGQNYIDAIKGLPETFVVGGGAGAILGGGQNFVQRARNRNRGGANATRADAQLAYAQELTENYGDDIVQNKRYDNAVHQIYEQASEEIKKMKPEQREKYLRSIGSQALAFNEDGSLRAKQAIDYNTEAMTASLRPVSGNLTFAPVQSNMKVTDNAKKIKGVIEGVKQGAKVVVTDKMPNVEGYDSRAAYIPSDDVFYINNDVKADDPSVVNAIALHELTHKGEGTKAYNTLVGEVSRLVNDPNAPAAIKAKLGNYEARLAETRQAYADQGRTEAQNEYVVQTEMIADYMGDLLSDEYFVRKLVERNKSVPKRILSALRGLASGENKNVDSSVKNGLKKLYKAYVNTIDKAGYGVLLSEVDKEELEQGRDSDKNGVIQYPEAKTEQVRTETVRGSLVNTTQGIAETDSKGRKLTAQQREFFKDTKAVDEKGRLLEVYHGSKTGDFTVFQYDSSRQTGDDFGKAYYFTTNLKNARAYAKDNHKDPRVKQYIEERDKLYRQFADAARRGESQEKLKALSNEFINFRVDGKTLMELLYDIDYDTGGTIFKVYLNLRNPLIVDAKGALYRKVYPRYFEQAKSNGNDGIIVKNIEDNAHGSEGLSDVYIAFSENQIKLTSNENPTADVDIRRSLARKDSEGKVLSQGQRDFFKDSKAVDEEGRLLRVYHGSKASPTVFSSDFISAGWLAFGKGFYFTEDKTRAQGYGKSSLYECYLNMKNPFISNDRAHLDLLYEKMNTTRDSILKYSEEKGVGGGELYKINYYLDDRGDDVSKYIRDLGFDGVIVDAYGTKELIVYESNQIKLTTNHNPTKSEDIRFSLKANGENISGEAEIKGDLVALHNLDERKLMKVLELGGFPMPSIAITRTSLGHDQYGKITVVFGRDTIDPQRDSSNVVYDRDAWTPTTPIVDVKLSNQGVDDLIAKLQEKAGEQPAYKNSIERFFDGKYRDNNGDYIVSDYDYTKEAFGDRALQNSGIMAAYLNEKGIEVEPVYVERGFTLGWESYTRDEAARLFDQVGITKDVTRDNATKAKRQDILEKYIDYSARRRLARLRRFAKNTNLTIEEAKETLRSEYDDGNVSRLFFMAEDFFNENRPKDIYDEQATIDKMQDKIADKQDFYEWFWQKIESVYEKKGIDNDSDIFDSRGNRRSFEKRHFAYTAANIVKAMSKGDQEGKAALGMTAGALAAKLSKKFESIEDIRDAKEYLALVSEEDLQAFNDRTYEIYDELVTAIAGRSSDFMSDSARRDDVGAIIAKCATAKPLTVENIKRIFEQETKGYDLGYKFNDKLAEQALLLFESLKHVPTTYFEAKPRRAVGLDEIKAVLLPNTASERVKTALTDKGIQYTQYDATDVNARRDLIEKMENVRFSRRSNSVDMYTQEQYNDFGWVRANEVLTYRQWSDFNHKFENMTEEVKRRQTKNGEYMIAVNDMKDKKFGVDNVIVFAKGTPLHPVVTKIIEINLEYETLIEAIREFIYEHEGNIDKGVFDGMLQIYNSKDFAHSTQQSGRGQAIEIDSPLRNGRRGTRSDSDDGDDGNKGDKRFSRVRSFQSADEDIRYSIRTKEPPKKTITAYKVFYAKDGGLYPPMVANPGGEPTPVGVWLDADVGEMAGTSATGRLQVKSGGKGTQGRGGKLAFRPGWHLGEYPKATQFNRLDPKTGKRDLFPKDFVWARCEIAADVDYQSEAESYGYTENGKYRHSYAGLPKVPEDGYYVYRTNPDPTTVPWYITGAMRVVEILDDNDVRRILQEHGQEPVQRQGGDIDLAQYGLRRGTVDNLRLSRKRNRDDHKFYYEMSRGEIKKLLANNTRMRVYAKKDIEQIINTVLDSYMSFGDKYGTLSNKNKAQVVDSLWQALNTAEKGKVGAVAIDAAEFIINSAVAEEMYEDYDRYEDVAIVNILRPYLNRINLDGIKGELLYIYDKEGFRAIRGRWGKRRDVAKFGIAPDELKLLLEDEGFHMTAEHPADVLAEVDSQYTNALARLKAKSKELFKDMLSAEERKKLRQDITREILIAADEKGAPSKLSKILEKYKKQLDAVKRRYDEVRHKNGAVNLLLDRVQKIKDIKSGAFLNATQYKSDLFKGSIEKLGRIKHRGNLNRVGTRKIFAALSEWYNAGNPMFKGMDGDQNGLRSNGVFNQEIKDMLDAIAQNEKPLTAAQEKTIAELEKKSGLSDYAKLAEWYTRANVGTTYSSEVKRMLNELARPTEYSLQEVYAMQKIVQYFTHIIETYNMVLKNGKYVDAKELATRYIERAEKAKKVKTGVVDRIVQSRYGQAFMDPLSIMRNADRYDEHGFFTETFFELQEGIIRSQKLENDLKKDFEEFFKSHKKYAQDLSERKVKYNGVEMSLDEALSLYMTLKREQAQAGLVYSGLSFEERSGKRLGKQSKPVHVKGLVGKDVTGLTPEEIEQTAKAARDDLAKQFNETDMQFVAMLEKALNEDCKEIKRKTDTQRMGYSNVQEGYYYPIRRGYVASNVDSFNAQFEIDRVSNASFNKDTVKGAKGELYIEPVTRVFERHVRGIAQYAGLSTFIDNYNMLYNIDIGDNPNNVNNIRKTAEEVWKNNSQYIIKMLSDAQGIRKLDVGDKIIQRIRGAYVKFALGANPKVWLTQTTSLLAATSVLDVKNVVKGLSVKGADVDTYCDLAEIRNHDNTIALAQGVIDSIGKVGDFLMKPIGMVDRWVVKKLFGACQYQIQQNGGAKVGTVENKKAAGELLTRVILQTQQNSMVTERSSAMRSDSEVARTLTMFTSDAMKVIGRVVDAIGEYTVLKKDKAGADKMKAARRKTVKAVGALVSTSVFMALIAQAFKTLYNKDDEDENIVENMAVDMLGNMLGGLPLIKDVYARLMEGYEVSNYAYSTINNLLDSANNIFQAASDWISGDVDSKQAARNIKNMIYAAGQLLGIPVRNIYNVFDGLISRFSASSAYKLDDLFYNQSYSSDLRKAIEEDDDEMASTIIGLMLNENIGDVTNENVRTELDRLVKSGHDVIPRSAPNSITYEGEEITLTAAQKRDFKQVYSEANNELASLVRLSAYRSASDDVKAKAVDIVYEMYYDLAVEDLIGEDLETKTVLFSKAFDVGKLALIVAQARLLTADKDDSGRSINGTKKAKIQSYINSLNLSAAEKYMIMGYLGYSNTYGEAQVQRYLRGIRGLTSTERQLLLEYSGYAA